MKIALSRSEAARLEPLACFDLGQKVTEVGAALAYSEYFGRHGMASDLSTGLYTAMLAAERLGKALGSRAGGAKSKAEALGNDLRSFNENVRRRWVEGPAAAAPRRMTPADIIEAQRATSQLRRRTMELWNDVRLMCPAPPAKRNGRKAR